jgi:hypothetical protein
VTRVQGHRLTLRERQKRGQASDANRFGAAVKQSLQICIARFLSVAVLSKSYCLASWSAGMCLLLGSGGSGARQAVRSPTNNSRSSGSTPHSGGWGLVKTPHSLYS